MTSCYDVAMAVGAALNASPRPPELDGLCRPGYPVRELQPQQLAPGYILVTIHKDGYGYKQHKKKKVGRFTSMRQYQLMSYIHSRLPQYLAVTFIMDSDEDIKLIVEVLEENV